MKKLFVCPLLSVVLLLLCSCAAPAPATSAEGIADEETVTTRATQEHPSSTEELVPDPNDPKYYVVEDERFTPDAVQNVAIPQYADGEHLAVSYLDAQGDVKSELISVPLLPMSSLIPEVTS